MDASGRYENDGEESPPRRTMLQGIEDREDGTTHASLRNQPGQPASSRSLQPSLRRAPSELRHGHESPAIPSASTAPNTPRVRFSLDVERTLDAGASSPTASIPRSPSTGRTEQSSRGLSSNSVAIDIDAANATINHNDSTKAPAAATSQGSAYSPGSSSMSSRSSPSKHSRGYSLRRALFTKSVQHQMGNATMPGDTICLSERGDGQNPPVTTSGAQDGQAGSKEQATAETRAQDLGKPALQSGGGSALPNYELWFRRKGARMGALGVVKNACRKVYKVVLRIQDIQPTKDGRHIDLDFAQKRPLIDERTGRPYISNIIRSSRYTIWTFLPRQLFAQFSKLANFYFLSVSVLQMIPTLSTTGTYTTIAPLLFFVSLSMAKEGYDDFRRYRLDKIENNRDTQVLRVEQQPKAATEDKGPHSPKHGGTSAQWVQAKWRDVQVGDVVRLERDDAAPADLVLLHSHGHNNMAYFETMALDGETNLKSKQACPALAQLCSDADQLAQCAAHFVVEDPNLDLYNFEGKVAIAGDMKPLTSTEVIYRGSILRNTESVYGLVISTGEECKIRMNANKNPRIKAPSLQARVNRVVIIVVIFVIALSIFNTVAYQIWSNGTEDKSWYLSNAGVSFFPIFASFIIMFNTLIPLSLYVSLEIIKLAQIYLLNDIDMYDEASDTPMEPRTSTINEELGQVSYIFSDKTGTLTDNMMRLRKLSIAGIAYAHDHDLQKEAGQERSALRHKKRKQRKADKGKHLAVEEAFLARKSGGSDYQALGGGRKSDIPGPESATAPHRSASARHERRQPKLRTEDLLRYLAQRPRTAFARKARFFLLSVALCHTCLPEAQEDGSIDYQAISPDEIALARAAQELGFMVVDRDAHTVTLKLAPTEPDGEATYEVYEVLNVIEFSSARKRMSIIVRFPDRQICIICKGADSTIMQLLSKSGLAVQKAGEVECRANVRKSMEAQEVIRRNSEHVSRKNSFQRPSMNLPRPSLGAIGRASSNTNRLHPIADEVDQFLTSREREDDFACLGDEEESVYYTPRPSAHFKAQRASMVSDQPRNSMHSEFADEWFDESLVLDDAQVFERCFQHINDFATEGLRTLLYGYRFLSEQDFSTWRKLYLDATTSLVDRQAMIERVGDMIEQDFELAGATAIEDRLQEGVPEAIDKLRRARIKLWMLTGDKRETAINVGHSCRLIKDYSSITILDHKSGEVGQHMAAALIEYNKGSIAHSVVVIDGMTLAHIEANETSMSLFLNLAILVDTVICCRASPSQKAMLVKAIRKKVKDSVTLAIGDGANDIAMIQEAHVGIGITGKEGLQAARCSDYSIAQFRFLLKLLLVHGRWNYIRTCKYTLATFWKEALFYLTQALYQRWAGYTGTSLYEPWSLSMFNTLFTSLPVIFLGTFEKDLAASTLLAVPELYSKGQRSAAFNLKIYLGWMLMAASEAMIIYFAMFSLYGEAMFTKDNGLYAMGVLTYSASVTMISTKLQLLEMHNKSILVVISFVLSVGGWFLWNIMLSSIYPNHDIYDVKGAFLHYFGRNALWWLVLVLSVVACVVLEIAVASIRAALFPTDVDLFQEYEQDLASRKRFEEAASSELQQGWNRGSKRTSAELQREKEVQELLNRPRVMEEGWSGGAAAAGVASSDGRRHDGAPASGPSSPTLAGSHGTNGGSSGERRSAEIQEMLIRRFGSIKRA